MEINEFSVYFLSILVKNRRSIVRNCSGGGDEAVVLLLMFKTSDRCTVVQKN